MNLVGKANHWLSLAEAKTRVPFRPETGCKADLPALLF